MVLLRVLVLFLKVLVKKEVKRRVPQLHPVSFTAKRKNSTKDVNEMTRIETVRLCHFAQGPADDLLTKEVD